MPYFLKKFNTSNELENYKKNNFVTPHVFLDKNTKKLDYLEKYQKLEYISSNSTGGQYIIFDDLKLFENNENFSIDIKFNIVGNGKDNIAQSTLFGANDEAKTNSWPGALLRKTNDGYCEFKIKSSCHYYYYIDSTKYDCGHFNGTFYNKLLYTNGCDHFGWQDAGYPPSPINNIYEFKSESYGWDLNNLHDKPTSLFCAIDSSNQPFRFINAILYRLKITKGDKTLNLVPAKRMADQSIGLFDIVNNHFYTSQSNIPFIAGPVIK